MILLIAMILSALNRGAPQTRAPRPARIRLRRVRPARPTGAGERPGYGKAHMKPTWWPSTVKWKASKTADSMVGALPALAAPDAAAPIARSLLTAPVLLAEPQGARRRRPRRPD